jgi:7,8-dihydropterin-6-yl-methyl-4-(beta-D-ribofuranosyl)aminobenzene 5'-phosphate synthase
MSITNGSVPLADLTLAVVYDNNPYNESVISEWGFSCLIKGCENSILFDTGSNGAVLRKNMETMGFSMEDIDIVVISHDHRDHTGGLLALLKEKRTVTLYIPQSFPFPFIDHVTEYGAEVISVSDPVKICKNVYSTGEMGSHIREQSLVIQTDSGLVIITGCAHPGIKRIVQSAQKLYGERVFFIMGGFHLSADRTELIRVATTFKKMGIGYVGPCHCSGNTARTVLEAEFGTGYIEVGAGKIITKDTFIDRSETAP